MTDNYYDQSTELDLDRYHLQIDEVGGAECPFLSFSVRHDLHQA